AVAWYGSDKDRTQAKDADWHLMVAATGDGLSAKPSFNVTDADPEPVLHGDFGRALGDFLETDVGPDGRLYTIYAKRVSDNVLVNRVVITDGAFSFGAGIPANGPKAR